ncbi:MAG: polymer-forming cytoskeletal protein [Proteobacteria bacterium]|nr:polymer-forming cytoskeletal protein [Pseudomonadota bacterium]
MSKSKNLSIIDRDLVVDGNISSKGRLVIKGTVKGEIRGEIVVIAEEGSVYCDAKVTGITIGGTFEGEIEATEELVILSTGSCSGKVVCRDLIVESGGILNAEVSCKTSRQPQKASDLNKLKDKAIEL